MELRMLATQLTLFESNFFTAITPEEVFLTFFFFFFFFFFF